METTLNPEIAIQYDKPSHKDLLMRHMDKSTSKQKLIKRWYKLLKSNPKESEVQRFIEHFPYFLPGLFDYHNGPRRGIIVSKFPFGNDYTSDFSFVTLNSMMLQFTFIEIERPNKKIFNKDVSFTKEFNHSLQQVRDWKLWAENNIESLLAMYADLFHGYNVKNDYKTVRCYLIYGRRNEVISSQLTKERWSSIEIASDKRIIVMTYDRLTPHVATLTSDYIKHNLAVCIYKKRGFSLKGEALHYRDDY